MSRAFAEHADPDCEWCAGTGEVVADTVFGYAVYAVCACTHEAVRSAHSSRHGAEAGAGNQARNAAPAVIEVKS